MKHTNKTLLLALVVLLALSALLASCARNTAAVPEPKSVATTPTSRETEYDRAPAGEINSSSEVTADDVIAYEALPPSPAPAAPALAAPLPAEPSAKFYDREATAYTTAAPVIPSQSGLSAAYSDDNTQFNAYIEFLQKFNDVPQITFPVQERIIIQVYDSNGNPLPDARVSIQDNGRRIYDAMTYADGRTLFFPLEIPQMDSYLFTVNYKGAEKTFSAQRGGPRLLEFTMPTVRQIQGKVPVDILFILDTTGSMGNEINQLKQSLLIIHDNLAATTADTEIRFGMVMYKDQKDSYVTEKIPFTADITAFQKEISSVTADGGGDTPEDLQLALSEAVNDMQWRTEGVKLAFIITDAAPHLDYGQDYTLLVSAQAARRMGQKIFSVGTGNLDVTGEIALRQTAQYTMGKYIFLTYGERGESDGGVPGSVSHHTGDNYVSDKLEAVIIRFAKEEIGDYILRPLESGDNYVQAVSGREDSMKVIGDLFDGMISQLVSYSTMALSSETPVAVIPLSSDAALKPNADYFTEHLYQAAAKYKGWKSVDRINIDKILQEVTFNLSGLVSESSALEAGRMTGAELIITGSLYERDAGYEIYLRILRTTTGEVLSVTRGRFDKGLGL